MMEKSFGVFWGTGSMAKNIKVKLPTVANVALEEENMGFCQSKTEVQGNVKKLKDLCISFNSRS